MINHGHTELRADDAEPVIREQVCEPVVVFTSGELANLLRFSTRHDLSHAVSEPALHLYDAAFDLAREVIWLRAALVRIEELSRDGYTIQGRRIHEIAAKANHQTTKAPSKTE